MHSGNGDQTAHLMRPSALTRKPLPSYAMISLRQHKPHLHQHWTVPGHARHEHSNTNMSLCCNVELRYCMAAEQAHTAGMTFCKAHGQGLRWPADQWLSPWPICMQAGFV